MGRKFNHKLAGMIRYKGYRTQSAFAEAHNMDRTMVSGIITGRVNATEEQIEKFCRLLDCTAEQLGFESEDNDGDQDTSVSGSTRVV